MQDEISEPTASVAAMNVIAEDAAQAVSAGTNLAFVLDLAIGVGDNSGVLPVTLSARILATMQALEGAGYASPIFDTLRAAIAGRHRSSGSGRRRCHRGRFAVRGARARSQRSGDAPAGRWLDIDMQAGAVDSCKMAWTKIEYSRAEVDVAGELLARSGIQAAALAGQLEIIRNWRFTHYFPLNTFQITLRKRAHDVDQNATVVQRSKRLSSIETKLRRLKFLTLSEMQDLGGCRSICEDVDRAQALVDAYKNGRMRHELCNHDDYIEKPKKSGYRGQHLVSI